MKSKVDDNGVNMRSWLMIIGIRTLQLWWMGGDLRERSMILRSRRDLPKIRGSEYIFSFYFIFVDLGTKSGPESKEYVFIYH